MGSSFREKSLRVHATERISRYVSYAVDEDEYLGHEQKEREGLLVPHLIGDHEEDDAHDKVHGGECHGGNGGRHDESDF